MECYICGLAGRRRSAISQCRFCRSGLCIRHAAVELYRGEGCCHCTVVRPAAGVLAS
jgi:hypothetical protein